MVEISGPPKLEQAADLAGEVATMAHKYDMNVGKLKRQKVRLEKQVEKVATFIELQKEIKQWLENMTVEVNELPAVSEDPETAKDQLKKTKVKRMKL